MNHLFAVEKKVAKLVARAWLEPSFHEYLLEFPTKALKDAEIEVTDFIEVATNTSCISKTSDGIILSPKPNELVDDVITVCVDGLLALFTRVSTT